MSGPVSGPVRHDVRRLPGSAWARRLPLRTRLVAGFAAVMLVVLTAAGGIVYWRVRYALDHGLDGDLSAASRTIAPLVEAGTVDDHRSADATGLGWQVLDGRGRVLDHGGPVGSVALVDADGLTTVPVSPRGSTLDRGRFLPASASPQRLRITLLPAAGDVVGEERTYLLVAAPRANRDEALRELLLQLGLAGLGALVLTVLVGDRLAVHALLPVERYRRRAVEVGAGATGVRLDVPARRDDEVTRLGHTLNEMLDALERSVVRERRFVEEASHELRTPLALLSSRVQLARRRPRSVAEHEAVLDELSADVARLAALTEQLLAVASAEAASGRPADPACDAAVVARRVVERRKDGREGAPAETVLPPRGPVAVAVDDLTLERVLTNLLDNATAHGAAPVELTVGLAVGLAEPLERWAVVVVSDSGPGMPLDLLTSATERFSRAPEARARPGAGLGLALVVALLGPLGGELRLCHGGHHVSTGTPTGVECRHGERMSVTVVLPARDHGQG